MADNLVKQVSKYKLVFVGDQSVGKTSVINNFIYDNFTGNQQVRLEIRKVIQLHQQKENMIYNIKYKYVCNFYFLLHEANSWNRFRI